MSSLESNSHQSIGGKLESNGAPEMAQAYNCPQMKFHPHFVLLSFEAKELEPYMLKREMENHWSQYDDNGEDIVQSGISTNSWSGFRYIITMKLLEETIDKRLRVCAAPYGSYLDNTSRSTPECKGEYNGGKEGS